ncbi:UDP-glucose/GDP-mannose dehydrogenase family protein [Streptomyces filamentosus]|uniref:UDP-glucose/GDP-mannose dehydrogenase family protein n=1 Tax=Streptomyces filamentosus TaxID=67294 RepID=UPI0033F88C7F
MGLTFKAGTDDMREAPSAIIASRLVSEGAELTGWDPMARLRDEAPWNRLERAKTVIEAVTGCDAAMIVTEWPMLTEVDWASAASVMKTPFLFDGRNLLDPPLLQKHGFTYMSVGRATVRPGTTPSTAMLFSPEAASSSPH